MVSLQEQLMKAGLVDKKKVKVANQEKSKQQKIERRTGMESVNESREAALAAQRQQAERARALNAQRDAQAAARAVEAQIVQMVRNNRQPKGKDEAAYNFTLGSRIERIHVSSAVRDHLVAGRLAIVATGETFELVPRVIAEKIAERAPERVVRVARTSAAATVDEDDPYKDFKIPDDFDW